MKFSISSLSSPSIQRRENPEKRLNQLRSSTMADNNKFTQFFIKLFDNKTLTLQFPSHQTLTVQSIKHQIETLTLIPSQFQNLTLNGKFLHNSTSISPQSLSLTTLHLNFSLLGGKGGFGSLLRGAATKAGQKKTNNFDACRDMSGRRLRHVNAEKKLEEWKAEEEERRLEKVAEEYLKKMVNKGKGGKKEEGAEKYVAKYREDSAKCVKDVEKSVRESVKDLFDGGKKRKFMEKLKGKGEVEGVDAKKLKIWMGKRKFGESDSDDSDVDDEKSDESDVENEKSSVINNENQSDTSKDGSFGSASVPESDVDYLGGRSSDSGSEEEKETVTGGSSGSGGTPSGGPMNGDGGLMDTSSDSSDAEGKADQTKELSVSAEVVTTFTEAVIEQAPGEPHPLGTVVTDQLPSASSLTEQEVSQLATIPECPGASASESKSDSHDEGVAGSLNVSDALQPLNFDDYNSAAELEALGLERLKSELQARGLKCGGTLQERAARLFLLKTTPLEKLPKKLLAKK